MLHRPVSAAGGMRPISIYARFAAQNGDPRFMVRGVSIFVWLAPTLVSFRWGAGVGGGNHNTKIWRVEHKMSGSLPTMYFRL